LPIATAFTVPPAFASDQLWAAGMMFPEAPDGLQKKAWTAGGCHRRAGGADHDVVVRAVVHERTDRHRGGGPSVVISSCFVRSSSWCVVVPELALAVLLPVLQGHEVGIASASMRAVATP